MFTSFLLLSFGGISLLIGIMKTAIFIKKYKVYDEYKNVKGCVVEHISKEGHIEFDDEEFGFDAINYDEDDQPFLIQDGINTNAGVVEYVVNDKKYRLLDTVSDTNLMPIGKEVLVKYNPKKPKDAVIVEELDNDVLYIVGVFLIVVGLVILFK